MKQNIDKIIFLLEQTFTLIKEKKNELTCDGSETELSSLNLKNFEQHIVVLVKNYSELSSLVKIFKIETLSIFLDNVLFFIKNIETISTQKNRLLTEDEYQKVFDISDFLNIVADIIYTNIQTKTKINISDLEHDLSSLNEQITLFQIEKDKAEEIKMEEKSRKKKLKKTRINESALADFKEEADENLEVIQNILIDLEKERDKTKLDELFRSVHSIKGASDYIGLSNVTSITHKLENILDLFRKDENIPIEANTVDTLLSSIDVVKELLGCPEGNEELLDRKNKLEKLLITEFNKHTNDDLKSEPPIEVEGNEEQEKSDIPDSVLQIIVHQLKSIKIILGIYDFSDIKTSKPFDGVIRAVKQILKVATKSNQKIMIEKSEILLSFLTSKDIAVSDKDKIKLMVSDYFHELVTVVPWEESNPIKKEQVRDQLNKKKITANNQEKKLVSSKKEYGKLKSTPLKVDQDLVNNFTNLVGELIVSKNSLIHIQSDIIDSDSKINSKCIDDLLGLANSISQISDDLQNNVMKMRMVPVKNLFQKFPRMVRELSKKVDKDVELSLQGEDTEIDKVLSESLSDPLIHMVRNSLDHGIETKEERAKSGKPPVSILIIKALREGNNIVIEVQDDGKGINPSQILKKALENNLVKEEEVDQLSKEEILNLIFAPGFSTAKEVTNISGRGVGMDVVISNIKNLKGKVKIESDIGKGTLFRLILPLTVGIMESLIVDSHGVYYALPIENIIETVKIQGKSFFNIMKQKTVSLRNEIIPVLFLSKLMDRGQTTDNVFDEEKKYLIIILKLDNEKIGLIVDGVNRNQEIVVKPLPDQYSENTLLGGASIMGDGKAILIIDTNQIPKYIENKVR